MLSDFLKDYLPIIIFLVLALGLSCAFVVVNFILSPKKPDPEKLSAYECGFEPFEDSRMEFDVRFYLVAILSERRSHAPYGMAGGEDGRCGRNLFLLNNGPTLNLGGKNEILAQPGDRFRIETPGGGGWGVIKK